MRRTVLSLLVTGILGVACGGVASDQATSQPIASTPTSPAALIPVLPVANPSPSSDAASSSPEAQAAVDAALRDAAGRLSLANGAGDIHVQQVEARQWPDSSLGCAREGVMYSQVVTPGYLIVISAAGKQLEYHADARGRIVFCQEL